jgi:hypothetical protein
MNLKLLFVSVACLVNISLHAQKKVNVDLNFNVYKSVGNEILKNYTTSDGYLGLQYFDKKRFKNPFISITGNVSYPILKKIYIGLQTGIYMTFKEIYVSYPPTNHFSIPLQATLKYEVLNKPKYSLGVIAAGGINFFNIYELTDRYKNAALYNGSFYYQVGKSNFKFGLEKQIDNVTVYLKEISAYTKEDLYKYKLNRGVSIFISYGFQIK